MSNDKKIFDNLTLHAVKWPFEQPDFQAVIRLFLNAIPAWFCRLFHLRRSLRVYYIRENSTVLGVNYRNLEIRLYLIKCEEFSANLILIIASSYLNTAGFIQSLFLRPLVSFILPATLRTMQRKIPPQSDSASGSEG